LLKGATARAGQRYILPARLHEQLVNFAAEEGSRPRGPKADRTTRHERTYGTYRWSAPAAFALICVMLFIGLRSARQTSAVFAGLVTEVCDQHIAALASNSPPEVLSSDRHTVKPWFQGKLPFSFNLPQDLPGDTTLDGANLTYLHSEPTAQLLYSIGKHRASVFVQQRTDTSNANGPIVNHSGFHLIRFHTEDLEVVAVSDVDPARLSDLVARIQQAQTVAK
jgi:anti-sigma factor RsiW